MDGLRHHTPQYWSGRSTESGAVGLRQRTVERSPMGGHPLSHLVQEAADMIFAPRMELWAAVAWVVAGGIMARAAALVLWQRAR